MPVFKSGKGLAPEWCEMEYFDIVDLSAGEGYIFDRIGHKEKIIVGKGMCTVRCNNEEFEARQGTNLDIGDDGGNFEVSCVTEDTTLIRMCGRWKDEVGGSGLFWVVNMEDPKDGGDLVEYPKVTGFDSHYHDCDEYWIIYEGSGVAVSEDKSYSVKKGDCIATGMGFHHDLPQVFEPLKAVFFETTMEGKKRLGHLWNHTHGPALPRRERT